MTRAKKKGGPKKLPETGFFSFGGKFLRKTDKAKLFLVGLDELWVPNSCLKKRRDTNERPLYFIAGSFANKLGLRVGHAKSMEKPGATPHQRVHPINIKTFDAGMPPDDDDEDVYVPPTPEDDEED